MKYHKLVTLSVAAVGLLAVSACDSNKLEPTVHGLRATANTFENPHQYGGSFTASSPLHFTVEMASCSNSPGPQITLSGVALDLPGFGTELVFTNNEKGTHTFSDGVTVNE